MECLGLFANLGSQNGMTVNNSGSMFGRLVDDVLQSTARMDPEVPNRTTTAAPEPNRTEA
ncbi:hypothetical protein LINPERPRIM_LOCUS24774, partial [Linum perenne]